MCTEEGWKLYNVQRAVKGLFQDESPSESPQSNIYPPRPTTNTLTTQLYPDSNLTYQKFAFCQEMEKIKNS